MNKCLNGLLRKTRSGLLNLINKDFKSCYSFVKSARRSYSVKDSFSDLSIKDLTYFSSKQNQSSKSDDEYTDFLNSLKTIREILEEESLNDGESSHTNDLSSNPICNSREYLEGTYHFYNSNFSDAENCFEHLKNEYRKDWTHIGNIGYRFITRMLGFCKLKDLYANQQKILSGLLELENNYEFSKCKSIQISYKYKFHAKIDLLLAYIQFYPKKAAHFADEILSLEKEISILDPHELGHLYNLLAIAYFITSSRSYAEIKRFLKKSLNYHKDLEYKSQTLHNLALVNYYEVKEYNDSIRKLGEMKHLMIDDEFRKEQEKYKNTTKVRERKSVDYVLDDDTKRKIQKIKDQLNSVPLKQDPMLDKFYKKYAENMAEKDTKLTQMREILRKADESTKTELHRKLIKDKEIRLPLYGTKLDSKDLIDPLKKEYTEETTLQDIIYNELDYESVLEGVLETLYYSLCLHGKVIKKNQENEEENELDDSESDEHATNHTTDHVNFSNKIDLYTLVKLVEPYRRATNDTFTEKESIELRDSNTEASPLSIGDEEIFKSFEDIITKDERFSAIKDNTSTLLFLAELFTEQSRKYSKEAEFFLKYSIISSLRLFKETHSIKELYRSLALCGAFYLDGDLDQLWKADKILGFLYRNKELEKLDAHTHNLVNHLYGLVLKMNPKTKGEGLEIIDRASKIKEISKFEERRYHIKMNDFIINIDK